MTDVFRFTPGTAPVLISVPHAGTAIPDDIAARFTSAGKAVADTDWHVDRLYDFAAEMGCSILAANYSRYVVDLNRPPDDDDLYPGQTTTGLLPVDTFDGAPVYRGDIHPDMSETFARVETFWQPYHDQLMSEMRRLKAEHGHAILWEAHSIRSRVPRLFEGQLPDLNFGTNAGKSCDEGLVQAVLDALTARQTGFTHVRDQRFKGGFNTRNYGRPAQGWHAVQLEIAQAAYMEERPPFEYREDLAQRLRGVLKRLIQAALDWRG